MAMGRFPHQNSRLGEQLGCCFDHESSFGCHSCTYKFSSNLFMYVYVCIIYTWYMRVCFLRRVVSAPFCACGCCFCCVADAFGGSAGDVPAEVCMCHWHLHDRCAAGSGMTDSDCVEVVLTNSLSYCTYTIPLRK